MLKSFEELFSNLLWQSIPKGGIIHAAFGEYQAKIHSVSVSLDGFLIHKCLFEDRIMTENSKNRIFVLGNMRETHSKLRHIHCRLNLDIVGQIIKLNVTYR